jgi:hypothetical protein
MAKLKRKLVEQKLTELKGNVSSTAVHFGVTRQTLYNFIERHELQAVLDDARESMVDVAESALYRAAVQGEAWAVIWTLKTQGKKRGYVERNELALINPKDVDAAIERELARVAGRAEVGNAQAATGNAGISGKHTSMDADSEQPAK